MADLEEREGARSEASFVTAGGTPLTRRTFLAGCSAGALALGIFALTGCRSAGDDDDSSGSSGSESDDTSPASVARQSVVEDDYGVYYVDFATGSIKRTDREGSESQTLYTNGMANNSGIRYLACHKDVIYFGDVPSAEIKAVSTSGGDATTIWASDSTSKTPVPLLVEAGRVYFGIYDSASEGSELRSVRLDGGGEKEHLTIPSNFYFHNVDVSGGRVWYSGIGDEDHREIRSANLDGSDELVVFVLESASSEGSSLYWHLDDDVIYVEVEDDENISDQLLRISTDGSEEEVVCDFTSQKMMFDAYGDDFFFLDRDSFTLLALDDATGSAATLAQIPKAGDGTVVSILEAGDGMAYVTTTTAGVDAATEYETYLVERETGEPILLA